MRLPVVSAVLSLALLPGAAAAAAPVAEAPHLCAKAIGAIDASVARTLQQGSPGMAVGVSQRGVPVFVRAYGLANLEHQVPMTPEAVFKLASATKQFTAVAVLLLAQDGSLSLDDRLSRYVPELPQAKQLTLYQLLVHTSGLPDYAEDPAGAPLKSVAKTPAEMLAWIGRLAPSLQFEPGTRWSYSNSNYALLGLVIERVSGSNLQEFFAQRLFAPAGMTDTAFDDPADVVPHRTQGYRRAKQAPGGFANAAWISPTIPGPAGGLRTTLADLARWGDALLGGRVLAPQGLRTFLAAGKLDDGRRTKLGMPDAWQAGLQSDYGMGVFLSEYTGRQRVWHSGDIDGFSTWLAHYPAQDVTIALMENSESADMHKDEIEAAVFAGLASGSQEPAYCSQ